MIFVVCESIYPPSLKSFFSSARHHCKARGCGSFYSVVNVVIVVNLVLTSSSICLVLTSSSDVHFWHPISTFGFSPSVHRHPSTDVHSPKSICCHSSPLTCRMFQIICMYLILYFSYRMYVFFKIVYTFKKLIHASTYFILIRISTLFLY
jgi:hypothetical protein